MSEVDKQSEFQSSGFEIVVNLSPVFVRQRRNGFNFDDDQIVAKEIRLKLLIELPLFIYKAQLALRVKRYRLQSQISFATI